MKLFAFKKPNKEYEISAPKLSRLLFKNRSDDSLVRSVFHHEDNDAFWELLQRHKGYIDRLVFAFVNGHQDEGETLAIGLINALWEKRTTIRPVELTPNGNFRLHIFRFFLWDFHTLEDPIYEMYFPKLDYWRKHITTKTLNYESRESNG